jgi:hypothetical protein
MSLPFRVQGPMSSPSLGVDDPRAPGRPGRGRAEPAEPSAASGLACRDVIDEVRHRMASRGYQWE